jgi:hypothetical protein
VQSCSHFAIAADELGHPFIPFHLDIFRAVRRCAEALTGNTFGFRVHCCEILPFPLGDAGKHASTSGEMERVRLLHIDIVIKCVRAMFQLTYSRGVYQLANQSTMLQSRALCVKQQRFPCLNAR